jgi:copper oxidase (laccase) domain-containing protein
VVPAGIDLVARVVATDVCDGDLAIDADPEALSYRRRAVVDRPWLWLRQVHGADVVWFGADDDLDRVAGAEGDAAVSDRLDVVLAAHSADCATIALVGRPPPDDHLERALRRGRQARAALAAPQAPPSPLAGPTLEPERAAARASSSATIGVVHAGWRGLESGVIDAAVGALRAAGVDHVAAVLGPCIGAECYEFGQQELERVVARVGSGAAGHTRDGRSALDLRLGVRAALAALDVEVVGADPRCTACSTTSRTALRSGSWVGGPLGRSALEVGRGEPSGVDRTSVPVLHSHRARGDVGRQALVVWLERPSLAERT